MKPAGDAAEEKMADLVRQAKRGSREAFMELYKLFYHELYAYASYMLRHPQDAEDVVSDTIVAAFESIGKLRDVYRFRQWLFKILSNQCKKRRKTSRAVFHMIFLREHALNPMGCQSFQSVLLFHDHDASFHSSSFFFILANARRYFDRSVPEPIPRLCAISSPRYPPKRNELTI